MNAKTAAMGVGAALVLGLVLIVLLAEPEPATPGGSAPGQGGPRNPGGPGPQGPVGAETGPGPAPLQPVRPTPGPQPVTPRPTPPPVRDPRQVPATPSGGTVLLRLSCVDERQGPLQGVLIEAFQEGGSPLGEVQSDAQGQAVLRQIPSGARVRGRARHPLSRDTVTFGPLDPASQPEVRLVFPHSPAGRVRGRIVDDQGRPVLDAQLVVADQRQEGKALMDAGAIGLAADGSFAAQVAAGKYALAAQAPGFASSELSYLAVPEDGEADAGTLQLQRQGAIAGRVTLPPDLAAVGGQGLDLVLENTRGTAENPYTTVQRRPLELDPSLTFVVEGLDPGSWRLRLELPAAGQNRVGPWAGCQVAPGGRVEGVTLSLGSVTVSMRGTIRDDRGDPIEGAKVTCRGRSATSDRDGRWALAGVDPGDCFLDVKREGYAPGFRQVLYEGAELVLDFTLQRTGGVQGTVQGPDGPAGGVPVIVVQQVDQAVRPHETTTDGAGVYRIEGLPPGSYYIKAGPGADPFDSAGAPTVQVRPGEVVEAPLVVLR